MKQFITSGFLVLLSAYTYGCNNNATVEAGVAQNKLAEAGIESFVHDENVLGMNPLGGVKLKVFSKDLALAKKILQEEK